MQGNLVPHIGSDKMINGSSHQNVPAGFKETLLGHSWAAQKVVLVIQVILTYLWTR